MSHVLSHVAPMMYHSQSTSLSMAFEHLLSSIKAFPRSCCDAGVAVADMVTTIARFYQIVVGWR